MKRLFRIVCLIWPTLAVLGCGDNPGTRGGPPPKPEVDVAMPKVQYVADYEDFPGRVDPVNMVDVRARVTGYLDKMSYTEGADVKKDDLLFEIDARPYIAELARAEGNVVQSEGKLRRLDADLARSSNLFQQRGTSREEYDKVAGDRTEAFGSVQVAKANRDLAQLNVSYTKVRAPLSGRVSRRAIDPGNLVKADDTILTTIVSLDPVYAYFDVDERTTLRMQRLIREGKLKWSIDYSLPLTLGLADEAGFPRSGKIDFADNRVDPDTGTWRIRARFANTDRSLTPGLYVRIRLPIGGSYQATLVSEQALGTDQGQKFVYVVDKDSKVIYRRIKVGRLHDGLRVVTEGVSEGDRVIINGLQRVRPDVEVTATLLDHMPTVDEGQTGKGAKK